MVKVSVPCKLYPANNASDQHEIIVVGLGEIGQEQDPMKLLRTDARERLNHPLEAAIEPEIESRFGILVSEDDLSPSGKVRHVSPSVEGKETNFREVAQGLAIAEEVIDKAGSERGRARELKQRVTGYTFGEPLISRAGAPLREDLGRCPFSCCTCTRRSR